MFLALFWGAVAGGAVVISALLGIYVKAPARLIGAVMAFGAAC